MGGAALGGRARPSRLVYHAGALGDFITSLPAMDAWRGSDPTLLLGKPAHAALARRPFSDAWDAGSARFAPLFAPGPSTGSALAALFAGIDAALVFAAASSPLAENLRSLGIRHVERHDPFPALPMPVVDYHLAAVGAPHLAGAAPRVAAGGPGCIAVLPATVAIAPGSGSAAKNWPLASFAALSRLLEREGLLPAWVVGPAEGTMEVPSRASAWKEPALPDLAAALSRCRLYVGNDSGVTHLAAACGCPTLALFGPTDPGVWAPRGHSVRVVTSRTGVIEGVSVGEAFSACLDLLGDQERRRTAVRRGGGL